MADTIFGKQPILEALKSGQTMEKILVRFGTHGTDISKIYKLAKEFGVPIVQTSRERFRELAGEEHTQGVLAYVSPFAYVEIDEILNRASERNEPPFLLILDGIEDPHNLGALLRTAECAGVHGVVIPKHHAAGINATVVKTSAGAAAHVPVARVSNIVQLFEDLKKRNIWIIGADMAGKKTIYDGNLVGAMALVIGSEGRGMHRLVKETCDDLVRIPMYGKMGSLNASVSGALVMYEVARQRCKKVEVKNQR